MRIYFSVSLLNFLLRVIRRLHSKQDIFLLVVILGIISVEVFFLINSVNNNRVTMLDYSKRIIHACQMSSSREACYNQSIPQLMDIISMEEAFEVTREVQKHDSTYIYCHVLGHNVSSRETKKNPSKWMDVIARCPTTVCNNGCLHGAMMERFKSESLNDLQIESIIPDIANACEPRGQWHPREVERSMCYHGLGHLLMYITRADLNKSSALCERVGLKQDGRTYVQTCTQGVFMQMFQPLEAEDIALIADKTPKKEQVDQFCDSFSGERHVACHNESWPLFRSDIEHPEGTVAFCSFSTNRIDQSKCYGTAMSYLTVLFAIDQKNISKLEHFCINLPQDRIGECFGFAAARLVQIDPSLISMALDMCSRITALENQSTCLHSLAEFGIKSFLPESNELETYCRQLPHQWQEMCMQDSVSILKQ